jgi:hypothetical protein
MLSLVAAGCHSPISRTGKNEARISLTLARLLAILKGPCATRSRRSRRRSSRRIETSSSRFLPCAISWTYSAVRIDASARLIVYSGCACDGGGPGGGRLSCWSNRPRSPVGIVEGSVDAGGVARVGARDDHASIYSFEASLGAWQRRTASGGLRASTASC